MEQKDFESIVNAVAKEVTRLNVPEPKTDSNKEEVETFNCPECGAKVGARQKYCPECGNELEWGE